MGAMQNNPTSQGKNGRSRGTVKNASRLEAFTRGKAPGSAGWGDCDPGRLQAVVVAITALGGAITFGLSRDKGAHSLTLLLDDARQTMWYNGDADLDAELQTVAATLEQLE